MLHLIIKDKKNPGFSHWMFSNKNWRNRQLLHDCQYEPITNSDLKYENQIPLVWILQRNKFLYWLNYKIEKLHKKQREFWLWKNKKKSKWLSQII